LTDYRHIFIDSAESHVATLGGNFLNNFINIGVVEKGFCVVSVLAKFYGCSIDYLLGLTNYKKIK
jgi:hypothetical protein